MVHSLSLPQEVLLELGIGLSRIVGQGRGLDVECNILQPMELDDLSRQLRRPQKMVDQVLFRMALQVTTQGTTQQCPPRLARHIA